MDIFDILEAKGMNGGGRWGSPRKGARKHDTTSTVVKRLARQGIISSRCLPGGRLEVDLVELGRVVEKSIKPATATMG